MSGSQHTAQAEEFLCATTVLSLGQANYCMINADKIYDAVVKKCGAQCRIMLCIGP